jgi:hypothetical protein
MHGANCLDSWKGFVHNFFANYLKAMDDDGDHGSWIMVHGRVCIYHICMWMGSHEKMSLRWLLR